MAQATIQNAQQTAQATSGHDTAASASGHDTAASAIDQTYADDVTNENAFMQNSVNASEYTFQQAQADAMQTWNQGSAFDAHTSRTGRLVASAAIQGHRERGGGRRWSRGGQSGRQRGRRAAHRRDDPVDSTIGQDNVSSTGSVGSDALTLAGVVQTQAGILAQAVDTATTAAATTQANQLQSLAVETAGTAATVRQYPGHGRRRPRHGGNRSFVRPQFGHGRGRGRLCRRPGRRAAGGRRHRRPAVGHALNVYRQGIAQAASDWAAGAKNLLARYDAA